MANHSRVSDYSTQEVAHAIARGALEIELGPFTAQVEGYTKELVHFLKDVYRDVPARLGLSDVPDLKIRVRSPNILRRYIRPQVSPDPGFVVPAIPLPRKMSALAFEMGMNLSVALKCCRFMTLHSGVVANDKGSIIISAASGGGKSTLTAALMQEGYTLYSDEFGLVDLETHCLHAYPRPVSLKGASIPVVSDFAGKEWVTAPLKGTPKGDIAYRRVRPEDIKAMHNNAPAKMILFPSFSPGSKPSAHKIAKSAAFMRLIPSSTNYHLLGEAAFKALTSLVSGADAYELVYGNTEDSVRMVQGLAMKAGL